MYYQLKKRYQQKLISSNFFIYLLVLFVFVSPKFSLIYYGIQFRTDNFIYILILVYSFLFFSNNLKKFDLKIIIIFFLINFSLSFYEDSHKEFFKQFVLISVVYIALKNYSKNFDENKFVEIYQKIGFQIIVLGYLIYFFGITQSKMFENIHLIIRLQYYNYPSLDLLLHTFNNFYLLSSTIADSNWNFFLKLLQINNPSRFQSICSEPATYAILISPILYFYLENPKKNLSKIFLLILSIILTQSIYGILGIVLCFLSRIKLSYKSISLYLLILFLSFNLPGGKLKYLISKSYTSLNIGYNEYDFDKLLKQTIKRENSIKEFDRLLSNPSLFHSPISEDDKDLIKFLKQGELIKYGEDINESIFKYFLNKYNFDFSDPTNKSYIGTKTCSYLPYLSVSVDNLYYECVISGMIREQHFDILISKDDKELIKFLEQEKGTMYSVFKYFLKKYYIPLTSPSSKNYMGTTSCAYLSNLFISIDNLKKLRFFGTGVGSHEVIYKKNISKWIFMKSNTYHCLSLNYKDAKSYLIRIFSELGIFGFIFLAFLLIKLKNKNKNIEIFSKIVLFLLFLQVGNYGLFKINIFILLLLKNSNFFKLFSYFKKNN